jgi:CBS domain-containing protein
MPFSAIKQIHILPTSNNYMEERKVKVDLSKEFPSTYDRAFKQHMERLSEVRIVEQIMSKDPLTIDENATMAQAANIMGKNRIGSLIVVREGKIWGIVTERDLLSRVLAENKDPKKVKVKDAMSTPLITIDAEATIKEAARKMINMKGKLAVFKGKKLVGIVTASDLIKSMPEQPETKLKVDDFMTKRVVSVDEEDTITTVARIMGKKRIGSVLVHREGIHYGIFTERDLLTSFLAKEGNMNACVYGSVSSPLITIPCGTTIHKAAYTMTKEHIRRLPVMKESEIAGIITARDLVEAYAK